MKNTKKALFTSALCLLLCCSMLIGTTFAWFTDEVVSGTNQIVAGNLDVELEYAKVTDGQLGAWNSVEGAKDVFDPNALWEPGRVEVVYLKVVNEGTLALKYQLGVNIAQEFPGVNVAGDEFQLSDHLVFKVVEMPDGLTTYTDREAVAAAAGTEKGLKAYDGKTTTLEVGGEDYVALIVYMPETVGNEANYRGENVPAIQLGVKLLATQVTAESDSFGDDYDEDAWADGMQVFSAQDLQAAINNGEDKIILMDNIETEASIVIPEGATVALNLNGKNINTTAAYDDNAPKASSAIDNNGTLTLVGEGTIKATNNYTVRNYGTMIIDGITVENGIMNFADLTVESGNISNSRSGKHTIYGNGAKLTVNGGTFYNGNPGNATIFAYAGEVVINDGEFSIADGTATFGWTSCLLDAQGNAKFTINGGVINGEIRDYNKNTTVYGGIFAHSSVKNFVASGYKATKAGDVYMVTNENTDVVTNVDTLLGALTSGKDVVMTEDVKIDQAAQSNAYGATGINVQNGQVIDGQGNTLSVNGAGGTWDSGICVGNGTVKNITVTGSFRGIFIKNNTEKVILENVITDGTVYTISCDQGGKGGLEATNCTFKGWTSFAGTIGNVKFVGCTFGAGSGYNFSRPYAPTEYVGCNFEAGHQIDARAAVTFENCTINGEPLTADNLATLVTGNIANASVIG